VHTCKVGSVAKGALNRKEGWGKKKIKGHPESHGSGEGESPKTLDRLFAAESKRNQHPEFGEDGCPVCSHNQHPHRSKERVMKFASPSHHFLAWYPRAAYELL